MGEECRLGVCKYYHPHLPQYRVWQACIDILTSSLGQLPCFFFLVKHEKRLIWTRCRPIGRRLTGRHVEDAIGQWIMHAAWDSVWEQQSYSLCKYAKWNEIVFAYQCLPTMRRSIQWDLTCKESRLHGLSKRVISRWTCHFRELWKIWGIPVKFKHLRFLKFTLL